jgi:hypothetical protein
MRERDIFLALLELPDRKARAAFLDQVCGEDTALRAGVESLLWTRESGNGFLASPLVAPL